MFSVKGVFFFLPGVVLSKLSNNSGAARAQDQSVQRLDLRSHKTSGGIIKGQAETHRFTGVKIHGRKRALDRYVHTKIVVSRHVLGGTGFVQSKRGNSMNNPSNTTPWLTAGARL